MIRCGWGLERNRNGGNAVAAILALPAVAGKFGVRGGGYTLSNSGSWGITKSWIGADEPPTRVVNMNHLGRMLTEPADPPVKVLFVYNCNPLATAPHQNLVRQGLERDDLTTVVFDQVMTDTARYADIVLPATTFLEQYDFARAYGPISLQMVRPVVDAVGEARPNVDVFAELEARLGLDQPDEPRDELEMMLRVIDGLPDGVGEAVRADAPAAPPFGTAPVQFVDVFPRTPDGKAHLFPEDARPRGADWASTRTSRTPRQRAIRWRSSRRRTRRPSRRRSTSSCARRPSSPSIPTMPTRGTSARATPCGSSTTLGTVTCHAAVSPAVRPGTVALPKGLWSRHTLNGSTANALTPDTLSDIGAGACFNDARVQVERVARAADAASLSRASRGGRHESSRTARRRAHTLGTSIPEFGDPT